MQPYMIQPQCFITAAHIFSLRGGDDFLQKGVNLSAVFQADLSLFVSLLYRYFAFDMSSMKTIKRNICSHFSHSFKLDRAFCKHRLPAKQPTTHAVKLVFPFAD